MQIEVGQRIAARDDAKVAGKRTHERLQRPLHLEHDPGAALGNKRRIATELDGVAEALLGVQEYGLARDIGPAPQRLQKVASALLQMLGLPAPLVLRPAA